MGHSEFTTIIREQAGRITMPIVYRMFKLNPPILVAAATLLAAFLRFYRLTSLAPEAWFDEVWFALRARDLLQQPQFIVFYKTAWGGGNALHVYLTAFVQWLGLNGISSSRFASAALGVLAVPLAYACFREMLRPEKGLLQTYRLWTAALAAVVLSYLLYWVIVARVGTEPSLAPAAALFCVWQLKLAKRRVTTPSTDKSKSTLSALSVNSVVNYSLVGIVGGLAQYNGPHARLVLPLLAVIAVHDLFVAHASVRLRLIQGYLIATVAALVIAAPLIIFFVQNPEWFTARAQITVSSPLSNTQEFLSNLWFSSLAFNIMGSFDPLTNYPGLPMFDLVQSLGWLVGHGWALWHFRKSALARELLAWEIIMVLPSLLTIHAPNFQRMIGYAAPAAALIAIGWVIVIEKISLFSHSSLPRRLALGLLGFGIFISAIFQSYTLLVRYPTLSILPVSYLNAPVRIGRDLVARANAGERVFVSRNPEDDDVIAFEFLFPNTPVQRLDLRQCLPLTDNRETATNYLILTKRDGVSAPALYAAYPNSKISEAYYWQDSGTWFEVLPHTPGPRPPMGGDALFEPGLRFLGYESSGESIQAGQSLFITLWWKAEADLDTDYTSFIHVGKDSVVAQRDGQPCQGLLPTSRWRAGDLVRDSFALTIPPDAPAGTYPLAIGWYTYPDFVRLPVLSAHEALPDNRAIIGELVITR